MTHNTKCPNCGAPLAVQVLPHHHARVVTVQGRPSTLCDPAVGHLWVPESHDVLAERRRYLLEGVVALADYIRRAAALVIKRPEDDEVLARLLEHTQLLLNIQERLREVHYLEAALP